MNETLRIMITAVTADAQKNIDKVSKSLKGIDEEANSSGKSVDAAMKTAAKGAAVAIGVITALTAAMVGLSKSSDEFVKAQARVKTGFQSIGSTAQQANKTFRELFRLIGESDTAAEAANLLAKLSTNEQDLVEWTNILKGVYATFPDSLPVETLAESANETARVGKVTGTLADALNWAGASEDAFNAQLAQTNSLSEREALIRSTLTALYGNAAILYERNNAATLRLNDSQYRLNVAIAEATRYVIPLRTEFNNLAATALAVLKPAFETIAATLIVFVRWVIAGIQAVGTFFGIFSEEGTASVSSVGKNLAYVGSGINDVVSGASGLGSAFSDATKQAAKLRKETMGFDELNVVGSQSGSTGSLGGLGGGTGASNINIPNFSGMSDIEFPDFASFTGDLKKAETRLRGIATIVGWIVTGLGIWKIASFISDLKTAKDAIKLLKNMMTRYNDEAFEKAFGKTGQQMLNEVEGKYNGLISKVKYFGGMLMIAAGSALAISGYMKGWVDGVDWESLITLLGGVALAIGGILLAFGKVPALFASVIAGIAIFIVSLKDIIQNGASVENVIGLIMGALLVLIPVIYAFNTALLANPVMLVVAACAALAVGIAALVIEFASEEKAIKTTEEAQLALNEATAAATEAKSNYANAVDASEDALNRLQEAEKNAKMTGEELFLSVENGTLDYKDLNDVQRELYKAYIDNEQKQLELKEATDALKEAKRQETIASFDNQLALAKESGSYDEYKRSVIDAYNQGKISAEDARDAIGKSMSEMSRDAQTAFMTDIPNDIKNGLDPKQYETTGQKLSKWFSDLWSSIKTRWNNGTLINGTMIAGEFVTTSVPKMATGGIVTSSTIANIGEAGREAVLPLDSNTEWMDVLANRIASTNNTPSKIVLKVGEKELGEAAISSINGITQQTGSLQLQLA